jgi:hypothetical protein
VVVFFLFLQTFIPEQVRVAQALTESNSQGIPLAWLQIDRIIAHSMFELLAGHWVSLWAFVAGLHAFCLCW